MLQWGEEVSKGCGCNGVVAMVCLQWCACNGVVAMVWLFSTTPLQPHPSQPHHCNHTPNGVVEKGVVAMVWLRRGVVAMVWLRRGVVVK